VSGFQILNPINGEKLPLRTSEGIFRAKDLAMAVESVIDSTLGAGGDELALYKLAEPYRLDGPNPRPDALKCIFKAMNLMLHPAALENRPAFQKEVHRLYMSQLVSTFSSH